MLTFEEYVEQMRPAAQRIVARRAQLSDVSLHRADLLQEALIALWDVWRQFERQARLGATEDLRRSGILDRVVKADNPAPAFALANHDGQRVGSADLLARGPMVLSFFRGSW